MVAFLASALGFDVYGIEIQPDLVNIANELAEEFELDARFVQGTFVPPGGEALTAGVEYSWWDTSEADGYEELELDPEDFDVFFGYPWPGEESVFSALFARFASVGALLINYHGVSGVRVQRKLEDGTVSAIDRPPFVV